MSYTIQIIGFEGVVPEDTLVTYGAAAVLLPNGSVRNSLSGSVTDPDEAEVSDGVIPTGISRFKSPLELELHHVGHDLIVLRLENSSRLIELFVPGARQHLTQKREKPYVYYIFENRDVFRQYCVESAWDVVDAVMQGEVTGEDRIRIILNACLTLTPKDPAVLALRVHFSRNPEAARLSAKQLLPPGSLSVFDSLLKALSQSTEAEYVLKYEHGIAGDGGLDLEVALSQLRALHNVHQKLEPELRKRLPFITSVSIPEPRFQSLKAASAELGFGFLGSTLQQRVIRYFEFQLIAEIFAGQIPDELARDASFMEHLTALVSPPDTDVRHRPLDASELERVEPSSTSTQDKILREEAIHVLGYVEGIQQRVRRAELRIGKNHLISVLTDNDGHGGSPQGTDMLRLGEGFFRPAKFVLYRRQFESGRLSWFLRGIEIISNESTSIDTFPSCVIDKGLYRAERQRVRMHEGFLVIERLEPIPVSSRDVDSANTWLSAYHKNTSQGELSATMRRSTRWLPPNPFPKPTILRRIVETLGEHGGALRIVDLATRIATRYSTKTRVGSIFREVYNNEWLFGHDEDDAHMLTEAGQRWYHAIQGYASESEELAYPLFSKHRDE